MPSFLARLQQALAGQTAETPGAVGPDPAPADADAVEAPVPADLADLLAVVPAAGAPRAVSVSADGSTVVCWELSEGSGQAGLPLHEALLPPSSEPARWWPVVVDPSWEDALTEPSGTLEELADLDVEDGPRLLDQRWQAAHDRAAREERLGMHRGRTPADTVAAATSAVVEAPQWLDGATVAVARAHSAWQLPVVLGWSPVDGGLSAGELSALLQYWEEQWGAQLVALGPDSFVVRVDDPPTTDDDALAVAQEVLAVAPMLVSEELVEPLPRVAELLAPALLGAGWWHVHLG